MGTTAYEDQERSISVGETRKPEKSHRGRKRVITGFGFAMLVLLVFAIIFYVNLTTVVVSGRSMESTLHNGQRVLTTRAYWAVGPIKRDDIVVLRDEGPTGYMIKRVKWMAGETVDWKYVPDNYPLAQGPLIVPPGQIYVLGDNLPESEDSRRFGPVDITSVIGKVIVW